MDASLGMLFNSSAASISSLSELVNLLSRVLTVGVVAAGTAGAALTGAGSSLPVPLVIGCLSLSFESSDFRATGVLPPAVLPFTLTWVDVRLAVTAVDDEVSGFRFTAPVVEVVVALDAFTLCAAAAARAAATRAADAEGTLSVTAVCDPVLLALPC